MTVSPRTPLSDFNISLIGLDDGMLRQIYCLNPPPDSCLHGPCPNPDVTGYGQQVSLYITATIFAITLVHDTQHLRYAWYGYIANVYSLLVAAVLSISRGQLTRPDAIFVILAVASPATIYLWALSAVQLVKRKIRPSFLSRMTKIECIILLILSTCLLLFWFAMIALVVWPITPIYHIQFSQPACLGKDGGILSWEDVMGLIWTLPFFANWGVTLFVSLLIATWIGKQVRPTGVLSVPQANLFQWTCTLVEKVFNRHRYLLWKRPELLLFLMVMLNLLSYGMYQMPYNLKPIFAVTIELSSLAITLFLCLYDAVGCRLWPQIVDVLLLLVFIIFFVPSTWLYVSTTQYSPQTPSCLLIVTHFVWFINFWNHMHESRILRRRVFYTLPMLLTLFCTIIFLTCASFSEIWVPTSVTHGDLTLLVNLFPLSIYGYYSSQILWFITWVLCAYEPSSRWGNNITRIWIGIVHSHPIFKFSTLVLGPTMAWVSSTLAEATARSSMLSFGQIYALLTSIASLSSLILSINDQREEFLAAFELGRRGKSSQEAVPVPTASSVASDPLNPPTITQTIEESLAANPAPCRSNTW